MGEYAVKICCLNQLHRSKIRLYNELRPAGCGDCSICTPSEDNKNCSHYIPVKLIILEVVERKK